MTKNILFILSILTAFGCKKEITVVDFEGTPEFEIEFLANRDLQSYQAGVEDYFMHTDWTRDDQDIVTFSGKMALEQCDEICNSSIQIELRDFQPKSFGDHSFVDDFYTGTYRSRMDVPALNDVYLATFNGHSNYNTSELFWNFGDGLIAFGDSTIKHIYRPTADNSTKIFPTFRSDDQDGNSMSTTSLINFSERSTCDASFEFKQIENDKFEFFFNTGEPVQGVFWYQIKNGIDTILPINISPKWTTTIGMESTIFAEAYLSNGCIINKEITISHDVNTNDISVRTNRFDLDLQKIDAGTKLQLSTFAVTYVDENGTLYRSDLFEQTQERYFKILSKEPYLDNAAGQKTVKLEIEFVIDVFLPDGEFITLQDGVGTIAVAEP